MTAVYLTVRVQPGSRRTEWAESLADGTRKVKVAAPPEKGKANEELVRFLAAEYGVGSRAVTIVAGVGARVKRVRIESQDRARG
jgi:hypothetical protein